MAASDEFEYPVHECPKCLAECKPWKVKKSGPNFGKTFYSCKGYEAGGNCSEAKGWFEFADKLGIGPTPPPAADWEKTPAKRPRPAQSTSSSLPRQDQHVTREMCDQATLSSIWMTLKEVTVKLVGIEQKQDFIISRIREMHENEDPPASQAQ